MSSIKHKFNPVTSTDVKNLRDVKMVLDRDESALEVLITDHKIPQIPQIHILVSKRYDLKILQNGIRFASITSAKVRLIVPALCQKRVKHSYLERL